MIGIERGWKSRKAPARAARYRLLEQACAGAGILHLMLAHTLEDQAETVLLRLSRGSGVDGLAGMAVLRETASVRLLRPLLGIGKARLLATCRRDGQGWIEDPSNRMARFARGRLRRVSSALASEGLTPARLADTARRAGRARAALEAAAASLLSRAVEIYPEGYAVVERSVLAAAAEDTALRALSRCLLVVGGGGHPPRLEPLERLYRTLVADADGTGRTLGGCRVMPAPAGRLVICREPSATGTLALDARTDGARHPLRWDGRFRLIPPPGRPDGLEVRRLGAPGRAALRSGGLMPGRMPAAAALSLPGLWAGERLFALPQIVPLQSPPKSCTLALCGIRFDPSRRLTDTAFAVV